MAETTEQYRNRINQLKTSIENEPYMKNMRPDIAEGISKTGNRQADIEVRQDTLEDDFVAVQQDASSASPSGAEVAVARGGHSTLDERLTTKEQEVNAQLTQTQQELSEKSNLTNKYIKIINEIGDEFGIDVATFGKQGLVGDGLTINNRLHNYNDGTQLQIDNVGDGVMGILRQANNPSRRLDKPDNYVGNGAFFQFQRAKDDGTGAMKSTEYLLDITNDADLLWRKKRTVLMTNTKEDDGTVAFRIQPQFEHSKVLELNYRLNVPLFTHSMTNKTASITSGNTLTNGMHLQSILGPIQFTGGNGQVILNGQAMVYKEGTYQTISTIRHGAAEHRPKTPIIGEYFFDSFLKKPIWCETKAVVNASNIVTTPAVWMDANSVVV